MPRLVFSPIKGEVPIAGYGQSPDTASCAINTKFWHGLLQPHQCPKLHCEKDFEIKTMLSLDSCECVAWDKHVDVADCYCDFIVWTGDDNKPQIATEEEFCAGESCDLGVPCPTAPAVVSVSECIDLETPCKKACDDTYEQCIIDAESECSTLKEEADALEDEFRTALGDSGNCNVCTDDTDSLREKWQEKLQEYNKCLGCKEVVDAKKKCKQDRIDCKKECPANKCCDHSCSQVIYRYVNKYGHVGTPSSPSNTFDLYNFDGEQVSVSIPAPDGNHCITGVEIFVLISGYKKGQEKDNINNSGFMSVGIFDIPNGGTAVFEIDELGFEIDSLNNFPPPENLEGVTCHEYGLVGFEGKNIWYTESNQIGAWSGKKCLDHDIKCIEYWNGALYAFTDSWIYRLNLNASNEGYDFSIPFRYGERPFPIIGRQSKGQSGIFFPSVMGGVLVSGDTARVITSKFAKDDWLSLCHDCETSMTAIFDYGVGIFTKKASYIYEFGDGTFGELSGELYQLPFIANAVYTDKNGILNYAVDGKWYKWDNCYVCKEPCDDSAYLMECCCPYDWTSHGLIFDSMVRLTAGYIEFVPSTGDVKLEVFERDCSGEPIYVEEFNEGSDQCRKSRCFRKYFRIPACRVEDQIFIRLTGCAHVRRVVLGTSRSSLSE